MADKLDVIKSVPIGCKSRRVKSWNMFNGQNDKTEFRALKRLIGLVFKGIGGVNFGKKQPKRAF